MGKNILEGLSIKDLSLRVFFIVIVSFSLICLIATARFENRSSDSNQFVSLIIFRHEFIHHPRTLEYMESGEQL